MWSEQAFIKSSNSESGDQFGFSIALSKDSLAVGATQEDSSTSGINTVANEDAAQAGATYVFVRDDVGIWSEEAYVKPSNTDAGDQFGVSVALSGSTLAVGAVNEDSSTTGINSFSDNTGSRVGAAYSIHPRRVRRLE